MLNKIITETKWHPEKRLLVTHLSGDVDKDDIERWEKSLFDGLEQIENNGSFKVFVNLYGFKAINFEVHKRYRTIIPLTLAKYGWKVGYVDMFGEEANNLEITITRGITCKAAAHCHQDKSKINRYEEEFSRDNEHFFIDPVAAEIWISKYEI